MTKGVGDVDDARKERLNAYAHLATMGLMLVCAYEATPFVLGEGETQQLQLGERIGRSVDRLAWVPISACASALPFIAEASKRIPSTVGIPRLRRGSWVVPIGRTVRGRWVYHDFGGVVPHSIVAGSTKFGKTAFIKTVLYALCHQQPYTSLQVLIIDLKGGASFDPWRWLPHVLDVKRTLEEAESALADAEAEMWRRLDAIRDARMKFQPDPVFPRLFVVIDEGMVLAESKEAQKHLRSIASIGREPHVHLIYGTQRPSHEILPVTTRDQMEARFVFHLNEAGSSEVVLGEKNQAAFTLKARPGRMIYRGTDGQCEMQASYAASDVIDAWLRESADEVTAPVASCVTLSIEAEYSEWG